MNLDAQVAPNTVIVERDYVKVNSMYSKTIYIFEYPAQVQDLWLTKFLNLEAKNTDVSFFIQPLDTANVIQSLKHRVAKMEAKILHAEQKGFTPDFVLTQKWQDTMELITLLSRSQTKAYQTSIVVTVWGRTEEELNKRVEKLERYLPATRTRRADQKHKEGYLTQLPALKNKLANAYAVKNMHSQALTTMFPFIYDDNDKEKSPLTVKPPTKKNGVRKDQPTKILKD